MHGRLSPAELSVYLDERGTQHAIVGAFAVAVRGHVRTTVDVDLLTTSVAVLQPAFWEAMQAMGATVDIRRGDYDDPLAGVVHLELSDGFEADIIVGRYRWQQAAIERAEKIKMGGTAVPVVRTADLILLKLFAGGPIDIADIHALLAATDRDSIVAEVDSFAQALPADARELWASIRDVGRT